MWFHKIILYESLNERLSILSGDFDLRTMADQLILMQAEGEMHLGELCLTAFEDVQPGSIKVRWTFLDIFQVDLLVFEQFPEYFAEGELYGDIFEQGFGNNSTQQQAILNFLLCQLSLMLFVLILQIDYMFILL